MNYTEEKRGAIIITTKNNIYDGALIEDRISNESICAEESALIKFMQNKSNLDDIDLLVIYCDSDMLYYPCGKCLERISYFCDDCYILLICNKDIKKLYKLKTLYPFSKRSKKEYSVRDINEESKVEFNINNVTTWDNAAVCNWICEIGFEKYVKKFEYSNIDGKTLFLIKENDLENIGIPINAIPGIINRINILIRNDTIEHGLDIDRINDYICLLDSEKVHKISRLKRYFDKYDLDRDGCINRMELSLLLEDLHIINNELIRNWLYRRTEEECLLIFEDFVDAYLSFVKNKDPPSPFNSRSNKVLLRKRDKEQYKTIMQRLEWREYYYYIYQQYQIY